MRKVNLYSILLAGITALGITSCENGDGHMLEADRLSLILW